LAIPFVTVAMVTASERLPAHARVVELETAVIIGPQGFHPWVPLSKLNCAGSEDVGGGGGGGSGVPPVPEVRGRPPALRKAPARLFMKSWPSV
jgi:hypothetical protein